jgi:Xaa-Pro aminopeptidase
MMQTDHVNRLTYLRSRFPEWSLDAFLIIEPHNIRYLTGFSGDDGILVIGPGEQVCLCVDGRYLTQAKGETTGLELICMTDKVDAITSILHRKTRGVIGFEDALMTVQFYRKLREKNEHVVFQEMSAAIDLLRACKTEKERACIQKAAAIAGSALRDILPSIRAGIREKDIALELEYQMKNRGAEKAAFEIIAASGENSALPHACAGLRKIMSGDVLVIDYGAVYDGYHSDETCTFFIEKVESDLKEVYGLVKESHDRAIDAVCAGMVSAEIDGIARRIITEKGWGDYFTHGTGHGVGLSIHEAPRVAAKSDQTLAEGMVITVEPGIYLPFHWGIRIEDTVCVTSERAEILTKMSKELTVLG